MTQFCYILNAHVEYSRVMYLERCNIGVFRIFVFAFFQIYLTYKELPEKDDGEDDSQYA